MAKKKQAAGKAKGPSRQEEPKAEARSPAPQAAQPLPDREEVIRRAEAEGRPIRVYADGIFDMFHFGHARALEQAKKVFPNVYLLVGCCNDEITHRYKGKTVMTDHERYESLRHCKWVDEVIPDAPWVITLEFLEKHNIDFVAHDDLPYADASGQADDVYGPVKRMGKFVATQRTEGVSTSDLILRILKDYNEYVLRNLSRGYSRKDLGISLVKEQRIRASHNIKKLSERLKQERLRVADRITKRIGTNRHAAGGAAAGAYTGSGSGSDGSGSPSSHRRRTLLPEEVEARRKEIAEVIRRNGEDLAETVEQVVEKIMRGDYGKEVSIAGKQMDKVVSGFFRSFELGYLKLEQAIRSTVDWSHKVPGQGGISSGAGAGAAAGGSNGASSSKAGMQRQHRQRWAPLEFMSRPNDSDAEMEEEQEQLLEASGHQPAVTV